MSQHKLRKTIAEVLEIPAEDITSEASSDNIEAWDSLKHLDIVLNIERAYRVKFKTSEIAELVSVASIEQLLRQYHAL
jgi:acyl carrier protein